jgi:hypothetical protein
MGDPDGGEEGAAGVHPGVCGFSGNWGRRSRAVMVGAGNVNEEARANGEGLGDETFTNNVRRYN